MLLRKVVATGTTTPQQSTGDESSVQSPSWVLPPSGRNSPGVIRSPTSTGRQESLSLWRQMELLFQLVSKLLLFQLVSKLQISLRAIHIPGRMNIVTDLLSRQDQTLHIEWSLNPEVMRYMFHLWGFPHVDLFATRLNAKLPTFVSSVADPQALAMDALCSMAEPVGVYLPSHELLTKILTKLLQSNVELLVAPAWPAQPWCLDLLDMSINYPQRLLVMEILRPLQSDRFHIDPGRLQLHAWKLSGGRILQRDS